MGIKTVNSKLYVGDYAFANNHRVIIDRKKDILELVGNIKSKDHERFKKELIRAKEADIKLLFLVEELHNYNTLCEWVSPVRKYGEFKGKPYTKITGLELAKSMKTIQERYGVRFFFCNKCDVAQKMIELLNKYINN